MLIYPLIVSYKITFVTLDNEVFSFHLSVCNTIFDRHPLTLDNILSMFIY